MNTLSVLEQNEPFTNSFSLFTSSLQTVDCKRLINKRCQWLDSNQCPLVSKATPLSTVPQPHTAKLKLFLISLSTHFKLIRSNLLFKWNNFFQVCHQFLPFSWTQKTNNLLCLLFFGFFLILLLRHLLISFQLLRSLLFSFRTPPFWETALPRLWQQC